MAKRSNPARERSEFFRLIIRTVVPDNGFGPQHEVFTAWLNARLGKEGYVTLPGMMNGEHTMNIYLNDAAAVPELAALMERIAAERAALCAGT